MGGDGKIRILTSPDGERWESAALIAEEGVDLRDPKLCITPDNRLMLTIGGSIYRGGTKLLGRQPRVAFSQDGRTWTAPRRVLAEGDWLWRVTWHGDTAYGTSYRTEPAPAPAAAALPDWELALYQSKDGLAWEPVTSFAIPGKPNETTLRFGAKDEMIALVRREAADKQAWLGRSEPPYKNWKWQPVGRFIGGPNLLAGTDGRLIASGRDLRPGGPKTALGPITTTAWEPSLTLPSGGDTSYAGMVMHEGALWLSYYSSHEGKSAIYFAKVKP